MQNQALNSISSPAVSPQANSIDMIQQLEAAIQSSAQKLPVLMQQGLITPSQGQYLMAQLAKKSNEINMYKNSIPQANAQSQVLPQAQYIAAQAAQQPAMQNPIDLFNQERPGFFDSEGRADVLDYIKGLDMDKDEISKIAAMVEKLENSAVDGYLKKSAHEKTLNDENMAAKSKLTSYAQNAIGGSDFDRVFTREDIGRMSGEEFAKNEKLIMEQVKQGLIK